MRVRHIVLFGGSAYGASDLGSRQLIVGRGLDLSATVGSLSHTNVIGGVYHVKVFENEPVEITLQSGSRSLMDLASLQGNWERPSGFLNETGSLWHRPRSGGDSVVLYVSGYDHKSEGNVTVVFDTVPSFDPKLYDLRSSIGYLEPKFTKDHFSYFLRVPPGTSMSKLRLTAVDDKHTNCVVRDESMNEIPGSRITGAGITGNVALLSPINRLQGNVLSIECTHPRDPENPVRYIVQAVEQKGGSTRLRTLNVIGGEIDQVFHPEDRGVYTVDLMRQHPKPARSKSGWVSFHLVPENKRANVTVEGIPVDPHTWNSPYFRIPIGKTRLFHVGVKTDRNPVEETYSIAVSRPAPGFATFGAKTLNIFASALTALSTTRAYHFLHNFHVLQWISALSHSRGLQEDWYQSSNIFHKFNWGQSTPTLVALSSGGDRSAATYFYGDRSKIPYLEQDTPFSHPINRWALKYLPNALVSHPNSGDMHSSPWFASMFDREVLDMEIDRVREQERNSPWRSRRILLSADDDEEFAACLHGEEDCIPPQHPRRMLTELSPAELDDMVKGLERNYRETDLIMSECHRILTITLGLCVIGIGYITTLELFKRGHRISDLRKMYPRWLQPTRFWIFVFDLSYIGITQSTAAILFSPIKYSDIVVLDTFKVQIKTIGYLGLALWLFFGLGFVCLVASTVASEESSLLFANIFSRWHDSEIKMIKAIYRPFKHMAFLGRIFDVEICDVAPIVVKLDAPSLETKGEYTYSPIYLNEEPREKAPWCTGHTIEAFAQYNASGKMHLLDDTIALRDRHAMKYYNKTDETAVFLNLSAYHEGQYFNVNAKAMHEFPEAEISRFKKCVINNYGQVIELQPEIQLKHLPCVGDSFEESLMSQCIASRENLDMPVNDRLSNVIAKSQKGNLHWWIVERIGVMVSVIVAAWGSAANVVRAPAIFSIVAACLLAIAIPSAIATSLSNFWYKMETDYYLSLKTHKYDKATLQKFRVYPWRGEKRGHQKYLQINASNERLADRYTLYRTYNLMQDLVDSVMDSDLWRSRSFLLCRAIVEHQTMTEFLKAALCMSLLTAEHTDTLSLSLSICALAILLVNVESINMAYHQIIDSIVEGYFQCRTFYLATVDCLVSSVEVKDRLAFYLNKLSEAVHANAVSFIYDGFQSETSHDMSINDVLVVNNQMGTVMPGNIEFTKSNWRKILDEENPLTRSCYNIQKTVHIANGVGVYRRELYRSLPIEVPMVDLCSENRIVGGDHGLKNRGIGKLVATMQIINHNYIRYIPGFAHCHDDDSFLSFYTDPKLVPTAGILKEQYLGAGMIAQYDAALRVFRIKGPGIEIGKTYNIKIVDRFPQPLVDASPDPEKPLMWDCISSEHVKEPHGQCVTICASPGVLHCPVAPGFTPDLSKEIMIRRADETIMLDPVLNEVHWDTENRVMILYHERFIVRAPVVSEEAAAAEEPADEYHVTWHTRPKPSAGRRNFESVVAERCGELIVQLPADFEGPLYLSKSMFIRVRATDKSTCLDIHGDDTNAYEFPLTASTRLPRGGPGDTLIFKEAQIRREIMTWKNAAKHSLWDAVAEDRVPCTVVTCVDPITEDYRVEPDFNAARKHVESRITILKALRNQTLTKEELWRVWPQVMSSSEYANFWRRHLDMRCFDRDGKIFIDPLQETEHPQIIPLRNVIQQQLIPNLIDEIHQRINRHIGDLSAKASQLTLWRNAYDYSNVEGGELYHDETLYDLYNQWQRARAASFASPGSLHESSNYFSDGPTSEVDMLFERFRAKRDLFAKSIPNFCYPMIINKQFISRKSNWEAQFNQWSRQLHSWLEQEEVAYESSRPGTTGTSQNPRRTVFCATYYPVLTQFLTSLRQNVFKPEDLREGCTATVLHYVTNSLAVRGPNYYWKPDPLGSMFCAVRVWRHRPRELDTAIRSPTDSYWMSCHVKLTGNSVKIFRADGEFDPVGVEYDWNRANGWRIPLDCFEQIELGMSPGGNSGDGATQTGGNIHLKTLIGLITLRKNMNGRVDDTYVETIQDRSKIDNRVSLLNGDYVLQNGFDVPRSTLLENETRLRGDGGDGEAGIYIPRDEINEPSGAVPQMANIWPLQIRLFPRDLKRWESVIRACRMNYRRTDEIDVDYFDPLKPKAPPPADLSPKSPTPPYLDPTLPAKEESSQIELSDTQVFSVASDDYKQIPTPKPPPVPIEKTIEHDPDFDAPYKGEYENWRYKGDGIIKPEKSEELVVYRGGWKDGQRYGENCECNFRDPHKNAWTYKGGFYQDEFAGHGELVLRHVGDPATEKNAYCIKRFKGIFNLPINKEAARSNSLPQHERPAVNQSRVRQLFKNRESPTVHFLEDDAASSNATLVVLDDREALSLGGDEVPLALKVGKVADDYHKNKAKLEDTSSLSSGQDTLGDGQQGHRRYIPYQLAWMRKLDPTLGYQGLSSRFGVGLIEYSNGCTFDKRDKTGLYHGLPNSGGIFNCPICPLTYTGYMYRGRPDGRGHILFRPSSQGTTYDQEYKGEWKNGMRNGYGVLRALNGCLVAKGQWTDDLLDGEHCSIEISGALLSNPNIRMKSYFGGCKMGKPDGRGDMTFKRIKPLEAKSDNKDYVVYRGFFKNGVRDGPQGVMLDERGVEIYRGGFENDAAHGRVVQYRLPKEGLFTGNEVYTGNVAKGELSGMGILYNTETKQILYDGMWMQNVPHGVGVRVLSNGDKYDGQFVNGKPQGSGTLMMADGRSYEGPWLKAQPHGIGTYNDGTAAVVCEFQNGKLVQKKKGMCAGGEKVADEGFPSFPNLDLGGHNYQYWNATCKINPNWILALLQSIPNCWRLHEAHAAYVPSELEKYAHEAHNRVEAPQTPPVVAAAEPEIRITILEGEFTATKKNTPVVVGVLWEPRNSCTRVNRTDESLRASWGEVKRFILSTARENIGFVIFEGSTDGPPIGFTSYAIMAFMRKHARDIEAEETVALPLHNNKGSEAGSLTVRITLKKSDPTDVPPRPDDVSMPYDKFPEVFRNAIEKLADADYRYLAA